MAAKVARSRLAWGGERWAVGLLTVIRHPYLLSPFYGSSVASMLAVKVSLRRASPDLDSLRVDAAPEP